MRYYCLKIFFNILIEVWDLYGHYFDLWVKSIFVSLLSLTTCEKFFYFIYLESGFPSLNWLPFSNFHKGISTPYSFPTDDWEIEICNMISVFSYVQLFSLLYRGIFFFFPLLLKYKDSTLMYILIEIIIFVSLLVVLYLNWSSLVILSIHFCYW